MNTTQQPIKLGIIGAGLAVEKLHWPALRQLTDQFECIAVADVDPDHAAHVAALTGAAQTYTDYHDLLWVPEVEAVLISLPIHLQAHMMVEAVGAGKHVICEKPPATNLEQAHHLESQLKDAPVVIEIAENYRYRQDLRVAREAIGAGRIGEVVLIKMESIQKAVTDIPGDFSSTPWRHDNQYRGGPILDAGVHQIAALRDLGGPIEWLQAFTKQGGSRFGGTTSMVMNVRFRSGALGALILSYVLHEEGQKAPSMKVYGSTGTLEIGDGTLRLTRSDGPPEDLPVPPETDSGYRGEFENFYGAVRHGEPVRATLAESIADLELVMRALDSAEQAKVILL